MLEELLALGHTGAEYDAWLIKIGEGDQFGSGFVGDQSELEDPGAAGPQRPDADPRVRVRRDPALPRREVRRLPADRAGGARRVPVVAVLADGQRALPRRRLRPLLRLRADQDRIRDRPLRDGGEAPARRARPPPGRERDTSPATTTRSPTWRSGPGTARWCKGRLYERRRVPAGAGLQERACAGPTQIAAAAGGAARPHGQPHLRASRRASCTSATTPATSTPRRRTSWRRPAERLARRMLAQPAPIRCEDVASHDGFRRLSSIAGIAIDLRYASVHNFVGRDLYGALDCAWLHRQAAAGLELAAARLAEEAPGHRLLVLDALRPHRVQISSGRTSTAPGCASTSPTRRADRSTRSAWRSTRRCSTRRAASSTWAAASMR